MAWLLHTLDSTYHYPEHNWHLTKGCCHLEAGDDANVEISCGQAQARSRQGVRQHKPVVQMAGMQHFSIDRCELLSQ